MSWLQVRLFHAGCSQVTWQRVQLLSLLLLLHFAADGGQTSQTFLRLAAVIGRAALIPPERSE